jgi:preprotein translocase subunit SecE
MAEEKQVTATFGLMKYVHLTFITGAFAAGWLLTKIVSSIWTSMNLAWIMVPAPSAVLSMIIGAGVSVSVAFYLWKHAQVNKLVVEIVTELSRVTWPTKKELYASTIVVIIVSIIASIILGAFDAFWSWVTGFIY